MYRYFIGRLIQAPISIFLVTLVVFIVARLANYESIVLTSPSRANSAQQSQVRAGMSPNRPIYEQYLTFVGNAVRGDFGISSRWRQPVLKLVIAAMKNTIQLTIAAVVIANLIALPIGIISAMTPGSRFDRLGNYFALLGQSAPNFWVGLMLMLLFGVQLRLLPVAGMGGLQHIVLPAVTMGWFMAAAIARLTRSAILDVLDTDYVKMARIKGVPERIVVLKHALRNAAIPILTLISLQFADLLGGAFIVEWIFAWPGVGRLSVEAVRARDYAVVQGTVFITATLFVIINLTVDMLYAYLDPRIRYT